MTQNEVMSSMIMEQCSMDDLYRLKMDVHLLQSVMGNMCLHEMPKGDFSRMDYMSPVCDIKGAHSCYKNAHIELHGHTIILVCIDEYLQALENDQYLDIDKPDLDDSTA